MQDNIYSIILHQLVFTNVTSCLFWGN